MRRSVGAVAAGVLLVGVLSGADPAGADETDAGTPAERAAQAPRIATYPVPTSGAGLDSIVRGPDGNLWVTESKGWKLARVTSRGAITEFPVPVTSGGSGPTELASGADGYLWFLTDSGARIQRATSSGAVESIGTNDSGRIFDELVAGRGRGVWLTETGGAGGDRVYRLLGKKPDGSGLEGWSSVGSYLSPSPMAVAPDGALWHADAGGYLRRIDEAGNAATYPARWPDSSVDTFSLAFARDGGLWGTGFTPGSVATYPEGGMVGRFSGGRFRATSLPDLARNVDPVPGSMTLGPDGALWWAEDGAIGRITTTGVVSRVRIAPWQPRDLAFGPDGRLWFVDRNANRVGAITITSSLFPPRTVARSVRLTSAGKRVKGRVTSSVASCRPGRVVAFQKKGRKARKVGAGRANAAGKFGFGVRKRGGGKVYVVVKASSPSGAVRCAAARSRAR
ncbi:hypothetical protein ACIRN4_07410 [Pimelobacter simplex]|uniref:Vgb family protein n=1 Tax=Nocardioides simplex TaxID=2045 RepID=UPI0038067A83